MPQQAIGSGNSRKGVIGGCILCCLLISGITFIAFLPALQCGFTNWDDDTHVVDNLAIRAISFHNLSQVFTSSIGYYQPLPMLTFMAEYRLFGLNPHAFHCTSVLLHCLNVLLVFALIYALSGKYSTGLLVSLLFAVHPLRVESVAWIAERKDLLSSFFYLLSLIFYVTYSRGNRRKYFYGSILSLVFSLLSKPMAVSQPFVLLLIDYVRNKKLDKKLLLEKIPFLTIAAVLLR